MHRYVFPILLFIAVRAARGYPGHYLRRLVRNLTVLAIVMLTIIEFANGISLSEILYLYEIHEILAFLILLLTPWILADLIPTLRERQRH